MTRLRDVPIVTPARAIADGIELGLRPTLIGQAIDTAASQALITAEQEADLRATRAQGAA